MPATRTFPTTINAPLTQASMLAGIRDALTGVFGVNPLKTFTVGTEQFSVWEVISDATKTYGRFYYRLRVTNTFIVSHAVGATWTDATNTLGSPSAESHATTFVSSQPLSMLGFAGADYKLLLLAQGATQQTIGYLRPPDCPNFDEGSFPRVFIPTNADVTSVSCTGLSPYASLTFTTILGLTQMSGPDTFSQTRSLSNGFWIWAPSNTGILARTSDDLCMGAALNMARGDLFEDATDATKKYFVNRGGAGALLIRI